MGANPFDCPKCGGLMFNDLMRYGHTCPSCGNHEPPGHNTGGGGAGRTGAGAPGQGRGGRAGAPDQGGDGGTRPAGTGGGPAGTRLSASTLDDLASIVCTVYRGQALTGLFRTAGLPPKWNYLGKDLEFLSGSLGGIQRDIGPYGVIKLLEAACGQGAGHSIRSKVSRCLAPYGLEIGEGCGEEAPEGDPTQENAALFDQRGYHRLVVEHAGARFLQSDYSGAVGECYKWLEKEIRRKSGLGLSGKPLMTEALGAAGPLELRLPHLLARTQRDATEGMMHLCAGVSLNVRNPMSHETDEDFAMTRAEALDKLTILSYILGQLDKADRKQGPRRTPPKGSRKGEAGRGAARGGSGSPGTGGDPGAEAGERPKAALEVSPSRVERGGTIAITVTGRKIGGWHVGVYSEQGAVMSSPTRLDAHEPAAISASGEVTYKLSVITLNYGPGAYRVSVSSDKGMDSEGTRVKMFAVTDYLERQEADEVMDAVEGLEDRIEELERGGWLDQPDFRPAGAPRWAVRQTAIGGEEPREG